MRDKTLQNMTQWLGDFLSNIQMCKANASQNPPCFATRHLTKLRILGVHALLFDEATAFKPRINKNSLLQAQKELCRIQPDTVIFCVSCG